QLINNFLKLISACGFFPFRLFNIKRIKQRRELFTILSTIYRLRRSAKNLDFGIMKFERNIVWSLTAHRNNNAFWVFKVVNLKHSLNRYLVKDKFIAHIVVGRHGFGVAIEQYRLIPELARSAHC